MTVLAVNFSKMHVERKNMNEGNININNNVSVKTVEPMSIAFGKAKQEGIKFVFEYISSYEPDFANITLVGEVLFIESDKAVKEILDEWKKKKSVPPVIMTEVLNAVLAKCNIQSIILAKDMGLPSPIPLPKMGDPKTN